MNKETFIQEVDAATGKLYRVAYTILRNDDACKDAVQDTVLKAWEKRAALREPQYFGTWITRILINTCYSMQRKRLKFVSISAVPEPRVDPPDLSLSLALQALPEKLRLPFVLCYCEKMSYAEIGSILHLPVATVRGRIYRAKQVLKKELDAE